MKFKDFAESEEALKSAREEMEVARTEFKEFKKENKLKEDAKPTDDKLLKKYNKLLDIKTKKETAVEDVKTWRKDNKPKKEAKIRETKYNYPAEATTALDKKKFRATERARIKREAKEAAGGGKKEKKVDKKKEPAAPAPEVKSEKKKDKKKGEKKEKPAED